MSNTYGISTRIRDTTDDLLDAWKEATMDGHVCRLEVARITRYLHRLRPDVAELDDAVRLSASLLHIGPNDAGKRNAARLRDHARVHGPIRIDQYRRTKKRPDRGNDPSAA